MNRDFKRDLGQLRDVFSFLDAFAASEGIGSPTILPMRLAVEELFTNMVRHNTAGSSDISISFDRENDHLTAILTDHDVSQPFDPTDYPEVDVTKSLDEREIGGLGIHLVKRMVDEIHYDYSASDRRSRVILIKSIKEHA